jgi:hypothetical protein
MKSLVTVAMLLALTTSAAQPWPSAPPLIPLPQQLEEPVHAESVAPYYASWWYWLIWTTATAQTMGTVALGVIGVLVYIAATRPKPASSPPL